MTDCKNNSYFWGCLGGSVSEAAGCWFQLRSGAQGQEFKPRVGLHPRHEASLKRKKERQKAPLATSGWFGEASQRTVNFTKVFVSGPVVRLRQPQFPGFIVRRWCCGHPRPFLPCPGPLIARPWIIQRLPQISNPYSEERWQPFQLHDTQSGDRCQLPPSVFCKWRHPFAVYTRSWQTQACGLNPARYLFSYGLRAKNDFYISKWLETIKKE